MRFDYIGEISSCLLLSSTLVLGWNFKTSSTVGPASHLRRFLSQEPMWMILRLNEDPILTCIRTKTSVYHTVPSMADFNKAMHMRLVILSAAFRSGQVTLSYYSSRNVWRLHESVVYSHNVGFSLSFVGQCDHSTLASMSQQTTAARSDRFPPIVRQASTDRRVIQSPQADCYGGVFRISPTA